MSTNEDRANWAQVALDAFRAECGTSGEADLDIADLICDILHLTKRLDCNPLDIACHGIGMFSAEDRSGGDPYSNDIARITLELDKRTTEIMLEEKAPATADSPAPPVTTDSEIKTYLRNLIDNRHIKWRDVPEHIRPLIRATTCG